MARQPTPMRHIKNILRLKHQNRLSIREIARSCGLPTSTVGDYVQRAEAAGLGWPLPEDLTDAQLTERLADPPSSAEPAVKPLPDWPAIHQQLGRKSVTLQLLWEEYHQAHPDGYGYSRFCDLYGEWRRGVTATMRQTHVAGEKLFVDFAGDTMPVFDAITGEVRETKIFVAVLGASNYTYVEARFSEALPDWIGAHVNALAFLGGVPKAIVCDNLKAGVTTASRYEAGVNRTYQDLADH